MIIRNLDSDGNFCFGKGKNDYLQEDEAIKLNVRTRLKEWVNDCFFNLTAGIDWRTRLDFNQVNSLESDIRRIILDSYGVAGLVDFSMDLDRDTRKLSIQYQIKTIYSTDITDVLEV